MTDKEFDKFLTKCTNIPYKDYSWLKEHCYRTLKRPCSPNARSEHLAILDLIKEYEERQWIPVSEKLPNRGQWVLVTTEDYQKPVEIMCYQGVRIGRHDIGNGWEEYEYPSWTSGHGDVQGHHPKAWMPLPKPPESYKPD